jgi:hypothetical protein
MNLGRRYGTRHAVFGHVGIAALCASMAVACSGTIETQSTQRSNPVVGAGAGGAPPVASNNAGAPAAPAPAAPAPAAPAPAAPAPSAPAPSAPAPAAPEPTGALSFDDDVWPIFNTQCAPCHVSLGSGGQNIGSEDLDVALEDAEAFEDAVISTMEGGSMPLGCGGPPGSGSPCVSEEDFELIQDWYAQ